METTTSVQTDRGAAPVRHLRGWALGLPALRVALVGIACLLAWLLSGGAAGTVAFPPPPLIALVAMLPVNVVCLILVARLIHRDGRSVQDVLGLRAGRLLRDLLWGLLWLVVLYLPFTGTVVGVMAALHGRAMFDRFDTVFADPATMPSLDPGVWTVLTIVAVLTFAPLNAPTEELVYRGFAQGTLTRRWPVPLAVAGPAALFGLQHFFYAPTPDAVLVFACAFLVWGVGSGLIYHRQQRLMPLVFAHFLVNLVFTAPALAILITP